MKQKSQLKANPKAMALIFRRNFSKDIFCRVGEGVMDRLIMVRVDLTRPSEVVAYRVGPRATPLAPQVRILSVKVERISKRFHLFTSLLLLNAHPRPVFVAV